ncbi:hypothetical protein [Micromonospora sp. IBHARD004]|uniref:hypothetical protein n=1 Tax=Micromonospora sp. IBHARD004 TaxID=3457764 RepID=UPI0040586590
MLAAVTLLMILTACGDDGASPIAGAPTSSAPSATPTPPPAATASLLTAVAAALLTPADFGPGYAVDSDGPADPGAVRFVSACPSWRPPAGTAEGQVVAGSARTFRAPRGHYDALQVLRYAGDGAAAAMEYAQRRLTACARYEEAADPGVTVATTWTVLGSGFAGADSLAVRQRIERNGMLSNVDFHLLVRQGDLLAYVWLSDQRWTEEALRALGDRVAARLCAATEAC